MNTPEAIGVGLPPADTLSVSPQEAAAIQAESKPVTPANDLTIPTEAPPKAPETEPQTDEAATDQENPVGETIQEALSEDDLSRYTSEYATSGVLSEATLKEISTKAKLPEAMVKRFVEGEVAKATLAAQSIRDEIGGKSEYEKMQYWAASNLGKDDLAAFNAQVSSGNLESIKAAVKGLHARYKQTVGGAAPMGGRRASAGPKPFKDIYELGRAVGSKRYETDPSYRKEVDTRAAMEFAG